MVQVEEDWQPRDSKVRELLQRLEGVILDKAAFEAYSRRAFQPAQDGRGGAARSPREDNYAAPNVFETAKQRSNSQLATPRGTVMTSAPSAEGSRVAVAKEGYIGVKEFLALLRSADVLGTGAIRVSDEVASSAFTALAQRGRKWALRLDFAGFQQCLWNMGRAAGNGEREQAQGQLRTLVSAGSGSRVVFMDETEGVDRAGSSQRSRVSPPALTATVPTVRRKLSTPGPGHYYTGPARNDARTPEWPRAARSGMSIELLCDGRPGVEQPWGDHAFPPRHGVPHQSPGRALAGEAGAPALGRVRYVLGRSAAKQAEATIGTAPRRSGEPGCAARLFQMPQLLRLPRA